MVKKLQQFNKREKLSEDRYLEEEAANYLKSKGYKILERNFRTSFGEIDIIAKDKDSLCFVEVKFRSFPYKYEPIQAVDLEKRKRIIKVALYYLKLKKLDLVRARFDVLSIVKLPEAREFYLLKGAFTLNR